MKIQDKELADEVKLLFQFVKPDTLRKDIIFLLNQYHIKTPPAELKEDNQRMVENIELLMNFINGFETIMGD